MARRKQLGNITPDRFIVFNVGSFNVAKGKQTIEQCSRRTFTSYGDAAKYTMRCSRSSKSVKPCFLLHGLPGAERIVGRCVKGKCSAPKDGDRSMIDKCRIGKRLRRSAIAARVRERADRERGISPSRASKTGVRPGKTYNPETGELGRPRRRGKKRRR